MSFIRKIFKADPGKSADEAIDKKMKADAKSMKHSMSTLLLGAGGSGKSTILKQMEKINNGVIREEEMARAVDKIREHIVNDFVEVCATYVELYKLCETRLAAAGADDPEVKEAMESLTLTDDEKCMPVIEKWAQLKSSFSDFPELTQENAGEIQTIWRETGIRYALEVRSRSHIMDNTPWLFDRVDAIADPGYEGSFEAYVRLRDRTTGGIQRAFTINLRGKDWLFLVTDVGGQRSERKKWFQFFENVHCVLYVMALAAFDQVTFEDHTKRVFDDSFKLFGSTASSIHFRDTDWVVFMNKVDLFEEKLKTVDFRVYEPDFPEADSKNKKAIEDWVQQRYTELFMKANRRILEEHFKDDLETLSPPPELTRQIFFHVTCATDTKQIEKVMSDIQLGMVSRAIAQMSMV